MRKPFLLRFLIDGSGRALTMLLTIVLARALTVDDFGRLTFAISYVNLLYFFADAGTQLIFLRELGRLGPQTGSESAAGTVWEEFLGTRFFLAAAVAVIGSAVAFRVWPWGRPYVVFPILFWMIANAFIDFFNQACNAAGRLGVSAAIIFIHRGFVLALVFAAYYFARNLRSVSLGLGLGGLLGVVSGFCVLHHRLAFRVLPRWRPRAWFGRLRTSFPLALGGVFSSTYLRLGILLLPWLGHSTQVGYFGGAMKLFEAGYMVPVAFVSVAVPHLSKTLAGGALPFWDEVKRMLKFLGLLAVAWLLLGELLAGVAIRLLLGPAYGPAAPLLRILVLANALVVVNYFLMHVLVVVNRVKRQTINEGVTLAFTAGLTLAIGRTWGAAGAAWGLVGAATFSSILTAAALWPDYRRRAGARAS